MATPRAFCCLFFALLLAGCVTNPLRPPREEWPQVGSEFARALRWGGSSAAAAFVADEARPTFLAAIPADGSLQIIEARHDPLAMQDNKATAILALEYVRAPSVTVKRAALPLEWSCLEAGALRPCTWRLTLAPPALP